MIRTHHFMRALKISRSSALTKLKKVFIMLIIKFNLIEKA